MVDYSISVEMIRKMKLMILSAALVCAAGFPVVMTAQELRTEASVLSSEDVTKHARKMLDELMPVMIDYLRDVKDKESADRVALRFFVDKSMIMGLGEYIDCMGMRPKEDVSPEMMELIKETQKIESELYRNKFHGSILMACAWDEAYGMTFPEVTEEEKAAAGKMLDEQDAKKTGDILATVKDLGTADAAGRALLEKMAMHSLLAEAGYVPRERRYFLLSDEERAQLEGLNRANCYGSLLLVMVSEFLEHTHNACREEKEEDTLLPPELPQEVIVLPVEPCS